MQRLKQWFEWARGEGVSSLLLLVGDKGIKPSGLIDLFGLVREQDRIAVKGYSEFLGVPITRLG
jgi:hypothetical protein